MKNIVECSKKCRIKNFHQQSIAKSGAERLRLGIFTRFNIGNSIEL